jgi:peptidyl-prolyl cis-trans isomerase SurA
MRARLAALLVALMMAGCSVPTWVPLIGKEKSGTAAKKTGGKAARTAAAAADDAAPAAPSSPAAALASGAVRLPDGLDVMDRVICVVNNDAITMYELDEAEAHYLYETKQKPPTGEDRDKLRDRLLQTIIDNRMQLQQAEREKITVDDQEVQEQIAEIMKKVNAGSARQFEEALTAQGLTMDSLKKRLREQLLVQHLTRRKVALRISVTEQEIDRYLAANREKLETGLTFVARHILFVPTPAGGEDGWEAARRKAEHVYALLLTGEDFSELAKKYSEDSTAKDGGRLGTLKRGELTPEIERAILQLEPGESSRPFRSEVGYHLFHLDSKETLSGEALTQARNQIRDILYREKYDARLKEWISEMRQRAIIDIRL